MKRKKLVSALALTLALVCAFTLGANASSTLQEVKAYLNAGITIQLDGEKQTLVNVDGSPAYPITYDGVNYLPVRAICNMLGIGVNWVGDTQTIQLGKTPSGVDLIDTYDIYHTAKSDAKVVQVKTADEKTENIAGVAKSHWISAFTQWYGYITFSYNLLGRYDTLTFSYYSDQDAVLKLTGNDGAELSKLTITGGAVPKTITVPLFKTHELKFSLDPIKDASGRGQTSPTVYIFDTYLDAAQ